MTHAAMIRSLLLIALLVGGQWLSAVHAQSHDAQPQTSDTCELCLLASAHAAGATAATPAWLPPAADIAPDVAPTSHAATAPRRRIPIRSPPALNTH